MSPMFRQYHGLKEQHRDSILLFRMGDFYEMFYEDAKAASRLLDLTLTARGKGTDQAVPMCGFPHHQLESYTAKLIKANQSVAICDQVEDPKATKGLVRREVVRIVTPGTFHDPSEIDSKANRWMASVVHHAGRLGAAFLDVSTGAFLAWESESDSPDDWRALTHRLHEFAPMEIVHAEGFVPVDSPIALVGGPARWTVSDGYGFSTAAASALLQRHLAVASLDGFGFRDRHAAIAAAGGLLQYLLDSQECGWEHIESLRFHDPAKFLLLDPATRRNLELLRSSRDGSSQGSLIRAIDHTVTPAGGRLLREWLLAPLLDPDTIVSRQDAVAEWLSRRSQREATRDRLRGVYDIERLLSKTVSGTAGSRDLLGLRASLLRIPELMLGLADMTAPLLRRWLDEADPCEDIRTFLERAIADDAPAQLRDGGVIRDGFNEELDELRSLQRDGRAVLAAMEARERQLTGIASLKLRFNKVFGYFIEVSKPNLHLVPEHYHRKQTVANAERFVTPELKEYESKILHAQERIETLELDLFVDVRRRIAAQAGRLKQLALLTARLDTLAGFGELAESRDYCRPQITTEPFIEIHGGRHPVVEQSLLDRRFVPNDTSIGLDGANIGILTGPNMGGKSTYLRQIGLIALLSQAGSYVPAESAKLGIVDRIFCRVGASDNLAEGQSTFMVEMTETANILHHATSRSLVLLDEIGRGTSTFDGLSIAWAVVEHLHGIQPVPPRTLFATHYHELTELAVELLTVFNLRMAVRERGDQVVFTHRVENGASDRSYGIQVARLAGVPNSVVERARNILANLERDEFSRDGRPRRARGRRGELAPLQQPTLSGLFDGPPAQPSDLELAAAEVLAELRATRTDQMTPIDALNRLDVWVRRLRPIRRDAASNVSSEPAADD